MLELDTCVSEFEFKKSMGCNSTEEFLGGPMSPPSQVLLNINIKIKINQLDWLLIIKKKISNIF